MPRTGTLVVRSVVKMPWSTSFVRSPESAARGGSSAGTAPYVDITSVSDIPSVAWVLARTLSAVHGEVRTNDVPSLFTYHVRTVPPVHSTLVRYRSGAVRNTADRLLTSDSPPFRSTGGAGTSSRTVATSSLLRSGT